MIETTPAERRAIRSLERLAKTWPKSLMLFSWSGSLCVIKKNEDGSTPMDDSGWMDQDRIVADICGIDNDGGDP